MGLPTVGQVGVGATVSHSALFTRAYNLIWNEWFRDENLQNSVVVDKDDGSDDPADYVLLRRGKRKDYFTSALPWPQKGGTAVSLPLGTSAPVKLVPHTTSTNMFLAKNAVTGGDPGNGYLYSSSTQVNVLSGSNVAFDPNDRLS